MDAHLFQVLGGIGFVIMALVVFAGLVAVFGAESRPGFGEDTPNLRRTDWI